MVEKKREDMIAMMSEPIILVDRNDKELGISDKLTVHREGLLHRAFSVFIFDADNRLVLQKRSANKYHSSGLWSNTCCGHPRPGEDISEAAKRRLNEEMGLKNISLEYLFRFKYKVSLDSGFTEHELDHVFIGVTSEIPAININEVSEYAALTLYEIEERLKTEPESFTFWFRLILDDVKKRINLN